MNFLKTYSIHILLIIIILCIYTGNNPNSVNYVRNKLATTVYKSSYVADSRETANYSGTDSNFIQNNYVKIESKNSENSKIKIEHEVNLNNGVINSINSFYIFDKVGYNILMKIPSEKVDYFIKNVIKTEGKVLNENFSITNVTKQYNDNEGFIENLSVRRDRLRDLLKKSEKVDDILKIDRELTNVQNQLDSYLKANKNIKDDVGLTTINVVINPKVFLNNGWNIRSSFLGAVKNLIIFSQKMIDLLIYVFLFLPYLAMLSVLYGLLSYLKK